MNWTINKLSQYLFRKKCYTLCRMKYFCSFAVGYFKTNNNKKYAYEKDRITRICTL